MSTILVTGGAGFIGRSLVLRLLADGERVVAVDRRVAAADAQSRAAGDRLVEEVGDVYDEAQLVALFTRHRPAVVISLAENVSGPLPELVAHSAAAQAALFKTALAAGVTRVLLASSITVYMGLEGPFLEDMHLPLPSQIHVGAIKKMSEILALWYSDVSPLEVAALRLSNIYGPRYHSMMNTPSRYLYEALGRPIPEGLPPLGPDIYRQVADFCYVGDCAEAIALVARAPKLKHRIYNIGGGVGVTDADIRCAVDRAVGRNTPADEAEESPNYMDISRIQTELGFRPRHDLESGMRAYREWLEDQPL